MIHFWVAFSGRKVDQCRSHLQQARGGGGSSGFRVPFALPAICHECNLRHLASWMGCPPPGPCCDSCLKFPPAAGWHAAPLPSPRGAFRICHGLSGEVRPPEEAGQAEWPEQPSVRKSPSRSKRQRDTPARRLPFAASTLEEGGSQEERLIGAALAVPSALRKGSKRVLPAVLAIPRGCGARKSPGSVEEAPSPFPLLLSRLSSPYLF